MTVRDGDHVGGRSSESVQTVNMNYAIYEEIVRDCRKCVNRDNDVKM